MKPWALWFYKGGSFSRGSRNHGWHHIPMRIFSFRPYASATQSSDQSSILAFCKKTLPKTHHWNLKMLEQHQDSINFGVQNVSFGRGVRDSADVIGMITYKSKQNFPIWEKYTAYRSPMSFWRAKPSGSCPQCHTRNPLEPQMLDNAQTQMKKNKKREQKQQKLGKKKP